MDKLKRAVTAGWARYRSWPRAVQIALGIVTALIVLGAILGEPPDDGTGRAAVVEDSTSIPSTSTTLTAPTSTFALTTAVSRLDPVTTTVTTTASTSTLVASRPLTGFGATRATWDAAHQPAPGRFASGSAYGPLIDGKQPTYAAVFGDEHILGFSYYAPAKTSLNDLKALVRREFPPDAQLIDSYTDGRCRIESYKSRLLEGAIGSYTMVVAFPTPDAEYQYRDAIFAIGREGERDRC